MSKEENFKVFYIKKRFMNVEEVAEYLCVSKNTIRAWAKRGKIPCSNLHRTLRFDKLRLEPWLKKKERLLLD